MRRLCSCAFIESKRQTGYNDGQDMRQHNESQDSFQQRIALLSVIFLYSQ